MAYSAYTDIQNATGTTLSQSILESFIARADRQIDAWLKQKYETGTAGNDILKEASIELAQAFLIFRGTTDSSRPRSLSIGDLQMSNDPMQEIEYHTTAAKALVDAYIADKNGNPDVESEADIEETTVRADHIMGDMQLDQSTVKEYHDRADEYGTDDPD